MRNTLETAPRDKSAGLPLSGIDWDAQPLSLTTREAAALLGKSPGNIRARASKGDFGPTTTGPDGLPRYDRDRVRLIGERMAARRAQANPPAADAHAALWESCLEEAREAARQAKEEAKELRLLLHEREETTREALSHLDMLHEQNKMQMKEILKREQVHWERLVAAKNDEIERLKAQLSGRK